MNSKKIWCAFCLLLCLTRGAQAGFRETFDAYNRAVFNYENQKKELTHWLSGIGGALTALGTFNHLRSTLDVSDYEVLAKSVAFAATAIGAIKLGSPFFSYIWRWNRWAELRGVYSQMKDLETQLFDYAKNNPDINFELLAISPTTPGEIAIHAKLMREIGDPTGKKWIERARIKERPDYYTRVPEEVTRVIDQIKRPDHYKQLGRKFGKVQAGMIFAGPAGTGKTTLGQLIGYEAGTVVKVGNFSEFAHKYVGEGVANLGKFIQHCDDMAKAAHKINLEEDAKKERNKQWKNRSSTLGYLGWRLANIVRTAPEKSIRKIIIQFDEGQAAAQEHDKGNGDTEFKNMVEKLINEIDKANHHFFIVITTNSDGHDFREAVLRRFGNKVTYIGLPDKGERFNIVKGFLKKPVSKEKGLEEKGLNESLEPLLRLPEEVLKADAQSDFKILPYCAITLLKSENWASQFEELKKQRMAVLCTQLDHDQVALHAALEELDKNWQVNVQFYTQYREALLFWQSFADRAKDFSGAKIQLCLNNAAINAGRRCKTGEKIVITRQDIEAELEKILVADQERADLLARTKKAPDAVETVEKQRISHTQHVVGRSSISQLKPDAYSTQQNLVEEEKESSEDPVAGTRVDTALSLASLYDFTHTSGLISGSTQQIPQTNRELLRTQRLQYLEKQRRLASIDRKRRLQSLEKQRRLARIDEAADSCSSSAASEQQIQHNHRATSHSSSSAEVRRFV